MERLKDSMERSVCSWNISMLRIKRSIHVPMKTFDQCACQTISNVRCFYGTFDVLLSDVRCFYQTFSGNPRTVG
jgi:hypothetical protein